MKLSWQALATVALSLLTALGWGWWGYGATGDWSLEFADAHRLWLGHVPFRDFIPTYGILTAAVMAPFFALKSGTFAGLWISAAVLILAETAMVLRLLRPKDGRFEAPALSLLFVGAVAFLPSNSRYILGYSSAGFASVLLWTAFLLARRTRPAAEFLAGFLLGMQWHTKLDAGLAAVGMLAFLVVLRALRGRWRDAGRLLAGFLLPIALAWGALLLVSARGDLLYGATAEAFAQAGYVRDVVLGKRLLAGGALALLAAILCVLSPIRERVPLVRRWIPATACAALLLALALDGARVLGSGGELGPVALFYFWFLCWLAVAVLMLAELFGQHSLPAALGKLDGWRWAALLLAGAGLARCAVSGWFPLNYYQPAFFLGFGWLLAPAWKARSRPVRLLLPLAAGIAVLVAALAALPRGSLPFVTPLGTIRLQNDARWSEPLEIYRRVRDDPTPGGLLCTYMTGPFVATGREPSGLYTYGHRLAFSGAWAPQREALSLDLLRARPPLYVVAEHERATFAPPFGKAFATNLAAWVSANYQRTLEFNNGVGGHWTLLRRKDAP
ncbi:MAG: hypothetical protein IT578_06750 [Verrucomicrobiae bacterium]|nr:hypothetical protein [Verrucomicrobiae bacterium]